MPESCLLVLARADDPIVGALRECAAHRLVHADVADLFCAGWRYVGGRPDEACAVGGGRVIPADRITAVLCRVHALTSADVSHLHVDDRSYAVAEMNAFLRAWLAQYRGTRFNEPSAVSLAGPAWHPLRWTWHVARLAVPVIGRDVSVEGRESVTATVAGDEVIGTTDPALVSYSLRIAHSVRSRLLALQFVRDRGWKFRGANPCPPLDQRSAAAIVRHAFAFTGVSSHAA